MREEKAVEERETVYVQTCQWDNISANSGKCPEALFTGITVNLRILSHQQ